MADLAVGPSSPLALTLQPPNPDPPPRPAPGTYPVGDDGPTAGPAMEGSLFSGKGDQFDDDDDEADRIYDAIDERMSSKRQKRDGNGTSSGGGGNTSNIGGKFRELKDKLADVTEDQWAAIPDVGDYSLRHKQKRREDVFTPLTDLLLESRSFANADATGGGERGGVVAASLSRRRRAPPVCGARAPPAVWVHLAFWVVDTSWADEAFSADGAFSVDCAFSVPHAPGRGG